MVCSGCEFAGLFGLNEIGDSRLSRGELVGQGWMNGSGWSSVNGAPFPNPRPDIPSHSETYNRDARYSLINAQSGEPGTHYTTGENSVLPFNSAAVATHQPNGACGQSGLAGVNARGQYTAELAKNLSKVSDEFAALLKFFTPPPLGGRFERPGGPNTGNDPQVVYLIPLGFRSTPANGSCSGYIPGADYQPCTGSGGACSTVITYEVEVHSVRFDGKVPDAATVTEQSGNGTGSTHSFGNCSTTVSNGPGFGLYQSDLDPRGIAYGARGMGSVRTTTVKIETTLQPDKCDGWAIWKTNMRDWFDVSSGGQSCSEQFSDENGFPNQTNTVNTSRDDVVFGVYCQPCRSKAEYPQIPLPPSSTGDKPQLKIPGIGQNSGYNQNNY